MPFCVLPCPQASPPLLPQAAVPSQWELQSQRLGRGQCAKPPGCLCFRELCGAAARAEQGKPLTLLTAWSARAGEAPNPAPRQELEEQIKGSSGPLHYRVLMT